MDLDESHRATVAGENRDRSEAERTAPNGQGPGCGRWNRGGAVHSGVAKPVHDVGRFDPGPHDHLQFGESGAYPGEFGREGLLGLIDRPGLGEERLAPGAQLGSLAGSVERASVAAGVGGGVDESHGCLSVRLGVGCSGKQQARYEPSETPSRNPYEESSRESS